MFVWVPLAVLTSSSFTNRDARYAPCCNAIRNYCQYYGEFQAQFFLEIRMKMVRFSIAVLCLGLMAVLRHKCNGN